jgi:hypothetical protein
MKAIPSNRVLLTAAWGAAVGGAALTACSLGLGSEDSYFDSADAAVSQTPRLDGASSGADVTTGDEVTADMSVAEAAASPETGADSAPPEGHDSGTDSAPADAGIDVALPPAVLQVYYSFDDGPDAGVGTVLDHSGNGLNATLKGNTLPTIDPLGHVKNGLTLDGTQDQYAELPAGVLAAFESVSVAAWINLKVSAIWNRLFDFNSGDTVWMYFSPTGWNPTTMQAGTHFAISTGSHLDPEMILTTTLPVGAWHHVAIVLSKPYLIYYLDGVAQATLTNMTLGPEDIGSTPANWIGRSSYVADPYLSATIDEFRIYSGALTPEQVTQLATQ